MINSEIAIDLLYEALAAERRGMHSLAAIKSARASGLLQKMADDLRASAQQGDITEACLPSYLRRQAE